MRGQTTYTWWPSSTSSRTRSQTRAIHDGWSASGTTLVWIGARPAGSSASTEVSRSPKTVIATVRGIGVAVITRTCGRRAGLVGERGPLLDAEAVLLVDDHEAEVGELHRVLEQGVGADHDASLPGDHLEQRLLRGPCPSSR